MNKICNTCKLVKNLDEFHKATNQLDEHLGRCKSCRNKSRRGNRSVEISKRKPYSVTHNPSEKYTSLVHSAKKRGKVVDMVRADFIKWLESQVKECVYCRIPEEKLNLISLKTLNLTLDRKDNDVEYSIKNLALACRRCNFIKGSWFSYDEIIEIGKILQKKYTIDNKKDSASVALSNK